MPDAAQVWYGLSLPSTPSTQHEQLCLSPPHHPPLEERSPERVSDLCKVIQLSGGRMGSSQAQGKPNIPSRPKRGDQRTRDWGLLRKSGLFAKPENRNSGAGGDCLSPLSPGDLQSNGREPCEESENPNGICYRPPCIRTLCAQLQPWPP